jgi:hypothetical protein
MIQKFFSYYSSCVGCRGLAMDRLITLVGALVDLPTLSHATCHTVALVYSKCNHLVQKQGKPTTAQIRRRWDDNIKCHDRKIGCDDVNYGALNFKFQ